MTLRRRKLRMGTFYNKVVTTTEPAMGVKVRYNLSLGQSDDIKPLLKHGLKVVNIGPSKVITAGGNHPTCSASPNYKLHFFLPRVIDRELLMLFRCSVMSQYPSPWGVRLSLRQRTVTVVSEP